MRKINNHHWTYVVWCLGGTALFMWGMARYLEWGQNTFSGFGNFAFFAITFGVMFGVAWLFERNDRKNGVVYPVVTPEEKIEANRSFVKLIVFVVGFMLLNGLFFLF